MMPLAPTPIVSVPAKPKIGFSIDSIVGRGRARGEEEPAGRLPELEREDSSPTEVLEGAARAGLLLRSPGAHSEESDRPASRSSSVESYLHARRTPSGAPLPPPQAHFALGRPPRPAQLDYSAKALAARTSYSGGSTPNDSPSPPALRGPGRESPGGPPPHPPPPPGVVRPSPNYLGPPPGAASTAAVEQLKSLYGLPAAGPSAGPQPQPEYNSQHLALAANIAAQHYQAANLAVALQAHHGPPHGPYPHAAGPPGPHPPHPHPHQPPRDSYPLFPWLLSRHGRIFPQRFPGGECPAGLLARAGGAPPRPLARGGLLALARALCPVLMLARKCFRHCLFNTRAAPV